MKIVFISNYYNHHQSQLAESLYKITDFKFIETIPMRNERKLMGYEMKNKPEYVVNASKMGYENLSKIIDESDVIIYGLAPKYIEKLCLRKEKIVFRYAERPLKNGLEPLKYFPRLIKWHKKNGLGKKIYMLCASAYTATDYKRFCLFKNRTYKWGYFPETKHYESINYILENKKKNQILWCGRFLGWKHPEDAILIAKKLYDDGNDFLLKFIGIGELEKKLFDMVKKYHLDDNICFLGTMSPQDVRKEMEESGTFIFTSDFQEGWGAVLNESMNSACAVVASHAIGAVPFLIRDSNNGYIYESGNIEMLYKKVKYLLDNPTEQERVGRAAYETIIDEWNADMAAERFVDLANNIISGEKNIKIYESGPCSLAYSISEKYRGDLYERND